MEPIQTNELLEKLETFRRNPTSIQRSVYSLLDKASSGKLNIIDPTNPVSLLLEAAAVMSADGINECESLTRRSYSKLVTNEEDLYGHISDMEYVGVWGSPSSDTFTFMFNIDELKRFAKEVTGTTNKKVTLPRETRVTIANTDFSFAYPIDIIIAASGSMSVLYDTTELSPFMALDSNIIDYRTVNYAGQNVIMFQVTGLQYSVNSSVATLSSSTGFVTTLSVPNYLYYCRVYHRRIGGDWEEMVTTHSGRIYDRGIPTATLRLADSKLRVKVPEIYFSSGLMGVEIRIDMYTTKGDISLPIGEYPHTSVNVKWNDLNKLDGGMYSTPLSQLTNVTVTGSSITTGGGNGLSFEELQQRTVRNSTSKPVPVTELDLNNSLEDLGYDILSVVDNVTDRTFLASRPMPAPTTGLSSSPIGTSVESVKLDYDILSSLSTVNFSNKVWSILPSTLYKREGVGISMVSDVERTELETSAGDELIALLDKGSYFFNPFLTVLDTNDDVFSYNNYLIDSPVVAHRYFKSANSKVDYRASVTALSIYRTSNGYELTVAVRGSVGHEELDKSKVGLQLGYQPDGSLQRVYIEGVNGGRNEDGNLVFTFPIDTTFEVLKGHKLQVTSFNMLVGDTLNYPVSPDTEFDFIHYVTDVGIPITNRDNMHMLLGTDFAPDDAVAITHETANIRLFESLDGLINKSRVSINSPVFDVWNEDVPALYQENVYRRSPSTGHLVLIENDGGFEPVLLHAEGTPILDAEGMATYRFRQGDYKLDEKGQRVVIGSGGVVYYIDQLLLDGRYRFATESGTAAYVKEVTSKVVKWVKDDISEIRKSLIARTDLLFSPKTNNGTLTAYSVQGEPKKIDAALSVKIDLYVNYNAYSNSAIRSSIIASAKETVITELGKSKISTGAIHDNLRKVVGDDVLTIKVHSFNDDRTLDAFIVDNDSVGCSLAKLLERQPDGSIALVDDLEINFIHHSS